MRGRYVRVLHVRGAERRVEDRACAKSAITRGEKRMGNEARSTIMLGSRLGLKDREATATSEVALSCY